MTGFSLQSLSAAGVLLVPALGFAALATLLRGAPAEWGAGALLAWTAIAAALIAGAGLTTAPALLPGLAALLGFAALMVGGPPGLALAALAAGASALPAGEFAPPRWLPLSLALLAALVALRRYLG